MTFRTNSQERLRITDAGLVGIGTSSPNYELHVNASDATAFIQLTNSGTGTGASDGFLFYNNGVNATISNQESGYLALETAGLERLRITSAGLLGLGTSSPSTLLTVQGDGTFRVATGNVGVGLQTGSLTGSWYLNDADDSLRWYSSTGGDRFTISSAGLVGIGTTTPGSFTPGNLVVEAATTAGITISDSTGGGTASIAFSATSSFQNKAKINCTMSSQSLEFSTAGSERARIDSSGRLLVGTSSARSTAALGSGLQQIESSSFSALQLFGNANSSTGSYIGLWKSRAGAVGGTTIVQNGDTLGEITFGGYDGTNAITGGYLRCEVDGTPGANDMPGRLVFSTTADGAASPTERMRITSAGYARTTANTAALFGAGHEFSDNAASTQTLTVFNTNASYDQNGGGILFINCTRSATSDYTFLGAYSGNGADREFNLRGDGTGLCDGSWTGGGADYAEYFEWSDSNPDADDRRGIAVVLDGDKIRPALTGEDPIGVISGNPSVVGDSAWNKWSGKYLRDDYGTYIQEDYEVTDEDGNTVVQQRRKLNPTYNPDMVYTSREERPEWDCVGLMGKLRIRKDQPTGSRWIKMRDISATVEEWLVR
jgi:hypothetical protein